MQPETSNIKPKVGAGRPGPGRPIGFLMPLTVRKIAVKTLESIMQDESASPEARAAAACKLLDEVKA